MKRVIVESPYRGDSYADLDRNIAYLRLCMRDCLLRGEAPYASHALYTQPGVLDDTVAADRELGIAAGLSWHEVADSIVFYTDLGWSTGMKAAHAVLSEAGRSCIVERKIFTVDMSAELKSAHRPWPQRAATTDTLSAEETIRMLVDRQKSEAAPSPTSERMAAAIEQLADDFRGFRSGLNQFMEIVVARGVGRGSGG
jgi:hypothetical protein